MIQTVTFPDLGTAQFEVRDPEEHQQRCWMSGIFYEAPVTCLLTWIVRNVQPGSVVVDVGASIGNHTVFMAKLLGCKVIAIEPYGPSMDHLKRNVELNGVEDLVEIHECAVLDHDTECTMHHISDDNIGMVEMREGTGTKVTTLDKIIGPRHVNYIKIDTEYTEVQVVDGAERVLRSFHPLLSIECVPGPNELDFHLTPFGYVRDDAIWNWTPTYIYRWKSRS